MGWIANLPFWGVHVAGVVGVALLGWSWSGAALAVAAYYGRMFFLTAGYHRYFSHRAYRTGRAFQFLLALGGTLSAQKGVLWWAAHHRVHHKYSDQPGDVHSPRQRGLWWAHVGWILSRDHAATEVGRVSDLAQYPELRWLNRFYLVPVVTFAALLLLLGGAWALVWGFFVSTTLLWHGTFTINSLAHRFGRRRYQTQDDSRNNALLALLTLGEGWHNNHHRCPYAANQGFFWWEIDVTHYVLRVLAWLRVVRDLRSPPAAVLRQQMVVDLD
jgi:stearoyl-CoA desaturase (delta-9 desaturase)